MIVKAAPGEAVTTNVTFTDVDDEPVLDILSPVKFLVYVNGNIVINSTSATIDPSDSSTYTVAFTLPINTPLTGGDDEARLVVLGIDSEGNKYKHSEFFRIGKAGDESNEYVTQNAVSGTIDSGFKVQYVLPDDVIPGSVEFRLYNDNNLPMSVITNPTVTVEGGYRIYSYTYPDNHGFTASNSIDGSFIGKWIARGGTLTQPEVATVSVYIFNNTALKLIEDMRSTLDKANLQHIHDYLSWDSVTFAHHLFRGFDRVNGAGPITTNFSVNQPLPVGLRHYIVKAAVLSAAQAQYQAEGHSSFDFQGLGVQLSTDRLAPLDALINQLQADLERLPDDKKTWNQAGGPVENGLGRGGAPIASGITLGAYTNYAGPGFWDEGYILGNRPYISSRHSRRRS